LARGTTRRKAATLPGVVSLEDFDRYVQEHAIAEKPVDDGPTLTAYPK